MSKQIVLSKNEELILKMAKEEYKDLFPKIIEISQKDFMLMLEKYLEISLTPKNIILPSGTLKKILNIIQFQYYQKEYDKINQLINSIESTSTCEKYNGNNFYPHCNKNKEAIHSCGRKLFILNNYEYLLCLNCKKIYHPQLILLYCKNCSCTFYSGLDNSIKEEDKNLKPATWVKYHCNAIINDVMKCPTCQNIIYLNLLNNKLICKNCKFEVEQNQINWKCFICQKEFISEAKIYNPFEYKIIKITLKETLYNMIEAKPDFVPCCNLTKEEIQNHKFYHKKECNGIIYKGYIDHKKIVVCIKCHMLNYFEYHNWLCPICKERFRLKDYIHIEKRNKSENKKSNNNNDNKDNSNFINKNENENSENKSPQKRSSNFSYVNIVSLTEVKKELNKNTPKRVLSNQIKSKENNLSSDKSDRDKKEVSDYKDNNYNITSRNNFINPLIRKANYEKNPSKQQKKRLSNININLNFNLSVDDRSPAPYHYVPVNMNPNNIINPQQKINSSINKSNLNISNNSITNFTNSISNFTNNSNISISNNSNHSNISTPKNNNNSYYNSNNNTNNSNTLNNNTHNSTNSNINNTNNTNNSNNNDNKNNNKNNNNDNNNNNNNNHDNNNNDNNDNNNNNNTNNSNNNTNNSNNNSNNNQNTNNNNNNTNKSNNNNDNNNNTNNSNNQNNNVIKENKFDSDDYNIITQIGEGTFGKIYKVEGPNKEKYAMKKILANSTSEINALQSEYEMLLSLTSYNLNIVNIHGIETKKLDKTTFVMYVLMDIAIRDWEKEILLRNSKKKYYTEKELIIILKELIHTFAELQRHKISHRDIKPQNILLFPDNKFKITDFGEAKELMTNNRATIKQTIRGTELYMSPILFRALQKKNMSKYTEHNTFKSDVFSLGLCILFAATLTFNSLCDIRELNNSNDIKLTLKKYLEKKYSYKFNDFLFSMLEIDEKDRCDFIELEKRLKCFN